MTAPESNILSLPISRHDCSAQLDLFEFYDARSRSYNFIDIKVLDQKKLFKCIKKFGFRAILDIRKFPSFDRPQFEHRSVLQQLDQCGVFYLPALFVLYQHVGYSDIQEYKNKLNQSWMEGPLLLIHGSDNSGQDYFEKMRRLIEKRFLDKVEMHPRALIRELEK